MNAVPHLVPAPVASLVQIFIAADDGATATMQVPVPGTLMIGRQAGCDLVLENEAVSRAHARLVLSANSFVVEDLSSRGTMVEDGSIIQHTHRELNYGDRVRIGPFTMRVGEPRRASEQRRASTRPPTPGSMIPQAMPPQAMPSHALNALAATGPHPAMPAARSAPVVQVDPATAELALRRAIHADLLKNLDLAKIDPSRDDPSLRPRVLTALKRLVRECPPDRDRESFIGELLDEAIGLGPLEPLLADPTVTEIMVVDPMTIYVERQGKLEKTKTRFTDDERVRAVIERIVTPLGRRIDESQPLVDARLKDGSRVNAIIRPLALRGTCITIRKFPTKRLEVSDLLKLGTVNARMAKFLERCVQAKKNILISGGTGSGKTTLLNILSAAIPSEERIVTIEDAAELQLHQPHVVTLETKAANMEGKGAFTIRDLVKNSLRMRPDRIVVGECRGGEALDMLQAMNTGHDGSLTTIHANSPEEALARLETLVLMAGLDLPSRAIREQMGRCIHVIVQQSRLGDGTRKVTAVTECTGLDRDGRFEMRNLYEFERDGVQEDGKVIGQHHATGYLPSFVDEFMARGLLQPNERCL